MQLFRFNLGIYSNLCDIACSRKKVENKKM